MVFRVCGRHTDDRGPKLIKLREPLNQVEVFSVQLLKLGPKSQGAKKITHKFNISLIQVI